MEKSEKFENLSTKTTNRQQILTNTSSASLVVSVCTTHLSTQPLLSMVVVGKENSDISKGNVILKESNRQNSNKNRRKGLQNGVSNNSNGKGKAGKKMVMLNARKVDASAFHKPLPLSKTASKARKDIKRKNQITYESKPAYAPYPGNDDYLNNLNPSAPPKKKTNAGASQEATCTCCNAEQLSTMGRGLVSSRKGCELCCKVNFRKE